MAIKRYTRLADRTNQTMVAHPAKFIRCAFQPGSLSAIFSILGKKSDFLSCLFEIGSPKYVLGKEDVGQWRIS